MLSGEGLRLVYGEGQTQVHVLNEVSLSIGEREFVGIIGPSGSGKSSLLYVLAGLKEPTAGTVRFRDVELGRLRMDERAALRKREFGFVFQSPFLIGYLTTLENVLAADPSRRQRAEELLEELGIAHCQDKFPHQLSMGERQRVATARALVHKPAVIFADEPTASLDRANAELAIAALRKYSSEGALFVVTHDESILKGSDRILQMRGGKFE